MFTCFRKLIFRKADIIILCIAAILVVCSLADWWFLESDNRTSIIIENPYYHTLDASGNHYVINAGKTEILKVDSAQKIVKRISYDSHEEDCFGEADALAVDENRQLYVHDVIWNDTGLGLATERILRYDEDGGFVNVVFEFSYDDDMVMKRHIFALEERDGEVVFATVGEEEGLVSVYKIQANGSAAQEVYSFEWQECEDIQDITIADETSLYFTSKRGDIYSAFDGSVQQVYANEEDSYTLPYYLGCSSDETLYFIDICNYEIYKLENGEAVVYLSQEELCDMTGEDGTSAILQTFDICEGENGEALCLADNVSVGTYDMAQGTYSGYEELTYSDYRMACILFKMIAVILAAVICVYYAAAALKYAIVKGLFASYRMNILMICAISITAVAVMGTALGYMKNIYTDAQLDQMCVVTQIATEVIDSDQFGEVTYPADYGTDAYTKLQNDMATLLDVGSQYSENMYCNLVKMEDGRCYAIAYLDNSIGAYYPLDASEYEEVQEVYETKDIYINDGKSDATGNYVYVKQPILDEDGEVAGIVEVGMVSDVLTEKIQEIRLKIVVGVALGIIIAIFVLNEILAIAKDHSEWKEKLASVKNKEAQTPFPVSYFRVFVFVCFFGYNMPSCFLPVYVGSFYNESLPLSVELAESLPMTVNFMLIGFVALICARYLRKLGFRWLMIIAAMFSVTGDLMVATANSYAMCFLGLVLNGIGCGFIMSLLSILVAHQEDDDMEKGFSAMNSSMLSGMIVGMVVGAALAERIGKGNMFFISSAVWFGMILLALWKGGSFHVNKEEKAKAGSGKLWSLPIISFLLMALLPYILLNGFNSYYMPVFAADYGLSESQTSLLMVANCLVGVFLTGVLTNVLKEKMGRFAMYLASGLSFAALLLFGYFPNLYMLVFTMILLGVARSFGTSTRELHFCSTREVIEAGEDRAMGLYNFTDNVGESIGTAVFGGIANAGFVIGLWAITGISSALIVVYEWIYRRRQKNS